MVVRNKSQFLWSQLCRVVLLTICAVLCAVISFIVVMKYIEVPEATLTFIQKNVVVSLAGACAFYIILFLLMKWTIESFLKSGA